MTNTQVTLFQLDNYGPWTVTPEPRREPSLQALQSRLYADLCEFVGARDGYVFFTRFDNMVAVTNGLDRAAHAALQDAIDDQYPVSVSASVAAARDPASALAAATRALQAAGSAQDASRTNVLVGDPLDAGERTSRDVRIAHFDVVDATDRLTDRRDAFASHLAIDRVHGTLADYLYREHGSLPFFVGGDNVIAVCRALSEDQFRVTLDHVADETGAELRVGVGTGPSATSAGMRAKHALEDCRARDRRLAFGDGEATQRGSATSST